MFVNSFVTGTLICSRVAKVLVCPRALMALREQVRAFGLETRHAFLKEACWHSTEGRQEAPNEHQVFTLVCLVQAFALLKLSTASLINKLTPPQLLSSHASSGFMGETWDS